MSVAAASPRNQIPKGVPEGGDPLNFCDGFCFKHDLFRKPVPTFRDHALVDLNLARGPASGMVAQPG
jgi:hypothetical protein